MQDDSGTKLTKRQANWLEHIRRCQANGETVSSYAARHELSRAGMYRWRSRFRVMGVLPGEYGGGESGSGDAAVSQQPSSLGFIAARLACEASSDTHPSLRIHLSNGVVLEVGATGTGILNTDLLSQLAVLP
jgi:hypothetical protein